MKMQKDDENTCIMLVNEIIISYLSDKAHTKNIKRQSTLNLMLSDIFMYGSRCKMYWVSIIIFSSFSETDDEEGCCDLDCKCRSLSWIS